MPEFEYGDECRDLVTGETVLVYSVGDLGRSGWYWVATDLGEFFWAKGSHLELV